MFKKMSLFCLGAFCSLQAFANTQVVNANAIPWELKAGQTADLKNPFLQTKKARCSIHTEQSSAQLLNMPKANPSIPLFVEVIHGGGIVNNIELKQGQHETITLNDGDIMEITFERATEVKLTNNSSNATLKSECELVK